jgi:hypothetical protein
MKKVFAHAQSVIQQWRELTNLSNLEQMATDEFLKFTENSKNYSINPQFAKELYKTQFEFDFWLIEEKLPHKSLVLYDGAMVFIVGIGTEMYYGEPFAKILNIRCYTPRAGQLETHGFRIVFKKNLQTINAVLNNYLETEGVADNDLIELNTPHIRKIVSILYYLTNGQPDLREYKPPVVGCGLNRSARDRVVTQFGGEECVHVAWGWQKPRIFVAGSWVSDGHFWWAPVGEGRKDRKLLWRNGCVKTRSGLVEKTKEQKGEV